MNGDTPTNTEADSYGVRCLECGEWETACKCGDETPVIEDHCDICGEYESECLCSDEESK